jgi:hypothetical protein
MYFLKPSDPPVLKAFLDSVDDYENANATAHDRAILTLASAALALSLTFTKDLVPFDLAHYVWVLIVSWVGFVITLSINICGFVFALMQARRRRQMAFAVFRHGKPQAELENLVNADQRVILWANVGQGVLFLISMAFLTFYVCYNVLHGPAAAWARWAAQWSVR